MKERSVVSRPKYEAPKVVTYGREKLSKLVGPVKGSPTYLPPPGE